jgi:hypothetical protein
MMMTSGRKLQTKGKQTLKMIETTQDWLLNSFLKPKASTFTRPLLQLQNSSPSK